MKLLNYRTKLVLSGLQFWLLLAKMTYTNSVGFHAYSVKLGKSRMNTIFYSQRYIILLNIFKI